MKISYLVKIGNLTKKVKMLPSDVSTVTRALNAECTQIFKNEFELGNDCCFGIQVRDIVDKVLNYDFDRVGFPGVTGRKIAIDLMCFSIWDNKDTILKNVDGISGDYILESRYNSAMLVFKTTKTMINGITAVLDYIHLELEKPIYNYLNVKYDGSNQEFKKDDILELR